MTTSDGDGSIPFDPDPPSTDVEADEVFVVLSGRATVEVVDGPTLEIGPGDVGLLPAGARTTWTVHETLRKVYVVRP